MLKENFSANQDNQNTNINFSTSFNNSSYNFQYNLNNNQGINLGNSSVHFKEFLLSRAKCTGIIRLTKDIMEDKTVHYNNLAGLRNVNDKLDNYYEIIEDINKESMKILECFENENSSNYSHDYIKAVIESSLIKDITNFYQFTKLACKLNDSLKQFSDIMNNVIKATSSIKNIDVPLLNSLADELSYEESIQSNYSNCYFELMQSIKLAVKCFNEHPNNNVPLDDNYYDYDVIPTGEGTKDLSSEDL